MSTESRRKQIITFYSYKGGVGRSMALANVAVLLAKDHHRQVALIDWDLEAPGLHRFFGLSDDDLKDGVIDYFHNVKTALKNPAGQLSASALSVASYLHEVRSFPGGGSIRLMSAGAAQSRDDYVERVRSFDWQDFYARWRGAKITEMIRTELQKLAHFTFVDSRTGFTDVGSVCTAQLPDVVVFVFSFNGQNISGIRSVAKELMNRQSAVIQATSRMPSLLFMPSRKELTELDRLRKWERRAADVLDPFCNTDLIRRRFPDTLTYLRKVAVPYVPYFAYGEELATDSAKGYEMEEAFALFVDMLIQGTEEPAQLPLATPQSRRLSPIATPVLFFVLAALVGVGAFFSVPYGIEAFRNLTAAAKGGLAGLAGALAAEAVVFAVQMRGAGSAGAARRTVMLSSFHGITGILLGVAATVVLNEVQPPWPSMIAGFFSRSVVGNLTKTLGQDRLAP